MQVQTIAAVKESDKEKTETRHRVEEDRKPQVEAAIVRVMKSRKMLEHNLLITEARATCMKTHSHTPSFSPTSTALS